MGKVQQVRLLSICTKGARMKWLDVSRRGGQRHARRLTNRAVIDLGQAKLCLSRALKCRVCV